MSGVNSCVSDSGISTIILRFLHLAVFLPVALGHYEENQCFTHTHTHTHTHTRYCACELCRDWYVEWYPTNILYCLHCHLIPSTHFVNRHPSTGNFNQYLWYYHFLTTRVPATVTTFVAKLKSLTISNVLHN